MILVNSVFYIWSNFANEDIVMEICRPVAEQKTYIDIKMILDMHGLTWSNLPASNGNDRLLITENLIHMDS